MFKKEILEYSFRKNMGHIASSLSMVNYLNSVFKYVKPTDKILLGKPYGAQAYYLIWKNLGWIDDIENLNPIVKTYEINFIDFIDETLGNALGVASGIAIVSNKKVYVNLSDGALQMGSTLEAIQFIGQHQQNVLVTLDKNEFQVTGRCKDIINIDPVIEMCKNYNWTVHFLDDNDANMDFIMKESYYSTCPTLVVINTIKGAGIKEMEDDPKGWHYRKIQSEEQLKKLIKELKDV